MNDSKVGGLNHGGQYAYKRGCRCDACRAANAKRTRESKARRLAARDDGDRIPHGTPGGYGNWDCRCEPCKDAQAFAASGQREQRKTHPEGTPHGTISGYSGWNCRCEPCRAAFQAAYGPRVVASNAASRERAKNHGKLWTGPEMELLTRDDLSAEDLSEMLGRSLFAVRHQRTSIQKDPRAANLAGVEWGGQG